jgi:hypothetical protein
MTRRLLVLVAAALVVWGLALATVVVLWTSGLLQHSYVARELSKGALERMLAAGCEVYSAGGGSTTLFLRCPIWVVP